MTYPTRYKHVKAADPAHGAILVAERRVWQAHYLGWTALEASWQATLDSLLVQHRHWKDDHERARLDCR